MGRAVRGHSAAARSHRSRCDDPRNLERAAPPRRARKHGQALLRPGLTGGEDKDFFTRLCRQGARFAWADEAIVHDHVPISRANLRWVLRRAYRVGNSDMRVFLKAGPRVEALAIEGVKIAGALLLSPILFAILSAVPNRRVEALCKLWRAAGKTAAIFGAHYNEYATIHGG
jgi:hypothetical protein